jgi:hypothetical protein
MTIGDIVGSDAAKWIALAVYMGISEMIRRKKLGDSNMEDRIKLERALAISEQKDINENYINAHLEIMRFMVSKYKIYKSDIVSDIGDSDEKADGVILNCILKIENKLRLHIIENHFDKLEMVDLEQYLDYITNESMDTVRSYLKNRKLLDEYSKHFSNSEVRKINTDIIHTAISIKKRIATY